MQSSPPNPGHHTDPVSQQGECSGDWTGGQIVDGVVIPNLQTIEKREEEVAIIRSTLEASQSEGDDLNTVKVDLNIKRKDTESDARHKIDTLTLTKKSYHDSMRLLKKKKSFMEGVRGTLPSLQDQLKGSELTLKTLQSEKVMRTREVLKLKGVASNCQT